MSISNTFYSALARHNERHAYKRGQFQGHSPADPHRRARNHHRVEINYNQNYGSVVFHQTPIIRATPDGVIELRFSGYASSVTTVAAFNESTRRFTPSERQRTRLASLRKWGLSTPCVFTPRGWTPAYDGMRLDIDSNLISEPREFQARRLDKDKVSVLNLGIKGSGFKDLFPMIYSTVEWAEDRLDLNRAITARYNLKTEYSGWRSMTDMCVQLVSETDDRDEEVMRLWRGLITAHKFSNKYGYDWDAKMYRQMLKTNTRQEAWSSLMKFLKGGMYHNVSTGECFYNPNA